MHIPNPKYAFVQESAADVSMHRSIKSLSLKARSIQSTIIEVNASKESNKLIFFWSHSPLNTLHGVNSSFKSSEPAGTNLNYPSTFMHAFSKPFAVFRNAFYEYGRASAKRQGRYLTALGEFKSRSRQIATQIRIPTKVLLSNVARRHVAEH